MGNRFSFTFFFLMTVYVVGYAEPMPSGLVVVHAGHVIVEPGHPIKHEQTLVIENGRFVSIESGYSSVKGAINLKDAWLVPGLIDLHTHVSLLVNHQVSPVTALVMSSIERPSKTVLVAANQAQIMLGQGFTTLRNVGDPAGVIFDLRDGINRGLLAGPRIFGTQSQIVVAGGDYDPVAMTGIDETAHMLFDSNGICSGANDCRRVVRQEIRRGADVIKVRISGVGLITPDSMFETPEELSAIINTAHDLGRTVAVHSHSPKGSALALKLGADTIEHGLPAERDFKLFTQKRDRKAYFVPTLSAFLAIRPMMLEMTGKDWYLEAQQRLRAAYDAGVPIAFGTDAGAFPHDQANEEFGLMADAGMSHVDILKAATINAAEAMNKSSELGSISVGKWGDFVATNSNPLDDIRALENLVFVMKAGIDYTHIQK
jgi:imidazolonepropionase-like amidohydrolase